MTPCGCVAPFRGGVLTCKVEEGLGADVWVVLGLDRVVEVVVTVDGLLSDNSTVRECCC